MFALAEQKSENKWLFRKSGIGSCSADMRLFLIPPAGGDIITYAGWERYLPSNVELCIICLPERGKRSNETMIPDCDVIAEQIVEGMKDSLDLPYVIFGHSMGALLSYVVAVKCLQKGLPLPKRLMLSASKTPKDMNNFTQDFAGTESIQNQKVYELDDEGLKEKIFRIGGVPDIVKEDEKYMDSLLKVFRKDLQLCEEYVQKEMVSLPIPLTVYGGNDDILVSKEELEHWKEYSTEDVSITMFPGNHFYFTRNLISFLFHVNMQLQK